MCNEDIEECFRCEEDVNECDCTQEELTIHSKAITRKPKKIKVNKRIMILTDKAMLTRFVTPQEGISVVEPIGLPSSIPGHGQLREEFRLDATFEMNITSTSGKRIQLSFDLADGRHSIDTNELLDTISKSFMESKQDWENMLGGVKRYRLTLEEV